MNGRSWTVAVFVALSFPVHVHAQSVGLGARVGSLGLGGEATLGLSDSFALRGGFGVFPYEYEGEFEGEDYLVTFPTSAWSIGVDFYPGGGPFRLMGGFIGRSGDLGLEADVTDTRQIGGTTYTESGTLLGTLDQGSVAPFAALGFGKHYDGGLGLFVDLGVAFTGEPDVRLEATGPLAAQPGIQQDLDQEAQEIEDDSGSYLEFWPIVNLGFKIPLGG